MEAAFMTGMMFFAILMVVAFVVGLASFALTVWSLVDVLKRSDRHLKAAGQNRILWVAFMILTPPVGSLVYLFVAKPALKRLANEELPHSTTPPRSAGYGSPQQPYPFEQPRTFSSSGR